jgi:hypothetical protein
MYLNCRCNGTGTEMIGENMDFVPSCSEGLRKSKYSDRGTTGQGKRTRGNDGDAQWIQCSVVANPLE